MMENSTEFKGKHCLSSEEKLKYWGYGEWVEEPDECAFIHEGILCRIQRTYLIENNSCIFGGNWCGYVCIPENHPWHGKKFENFSEIKNPPNVHGGITYSEQERDGFWMGFDCAHIGDIVPSMEMFKKEMSTHNSRYRKMLELKVLGIFKVTYKNISFVTGECKSLAEQVKAAQT